MRLNKTQAQEMEHLAKKHGGVLRPAQVVAFARRKTTALHSAFEWDDTAAAERFRLMQAGDCIRACVTIIEGEDKTFTVRAFQSLHSERGDSAYRLTTEVLKDDLSVADMLLAARLELRAFRKKYAVLRELAEVNAAIDRVLS